MPKRTTIDIYADLLGVVKRYGGEGRITRISYGANLPIDRAKKLMKDLADFGLVRMAEDNGIRYTVTRRGLEFLESYWRMRSFLKFLSERERVEIEEPGVERTEPLG